MFVALTALLTSVTLTSVILQLQQETNMLFKSLFLLAFLAFGTQGQVYPPGVPPPQDEGQSCVLNFRA